MKNRLLEPIDRRVVHRWLRNVVSGEVPPQDLREWLRQVAIGDDGVEVVEAEAELTMTIVERLDVWQDTSSDLLCLCSTLDRLLTTVDSNEVAAMLIRLLEDRQRLVDILAKYRSGVVTRTQFVSFLSKKKWPKIVRSRIQTLGVEGLDYLRVSLESEDYGEVARLVT